MLITCDMFTDFLRYCGSLQWMKGVHLCALLSSVFCRFSVEAPCEKFSKCVWARPPAATLKRPAAESRPHAECGMTWCGMNCCKTRLNLDKKVSVCFFFSPCTRSENLLNDFGFKRISRCRTWEHVELWKWPLIRRQLIYTLNIMHFRNVFYLINVWVGEIL